MITGKHIHSAYDEDLNKLNRSVMTMGGLVENAIRQATKALSRRDDERAEAVVSGDTQIDKLAEEISNSAINIFALRQPQAMDLRTVVASMRTSISLERVGDYAKNIAKRTSVVIQSPPLGVGSGSVRRLSKAVRVQIKYSLDAYTRHDVEKSLEVIDRDEDIDQMYNALLRELLTHMMEDPRNISAAMHYLFIAKNLERMGDHATAIAEQTVYMVTGNIPSDQRSKNEVDSYDDLIA